MFSLISLVTQDQMFCTQLLLTGAYILVSEIVYLK